MIVRRGRSASRLLLGALLLVVDLLCILNDAPEIGFLATAACFVAAGGSVGAVDG